jgi:hypothetical protein
MVVHRSLGKGGLRITFWLQQFFKGCHADYGRFVSTLPIARRLIPRRNLAMNGHSFARLNAATVMWFEPGRASRDCRTPLRFINH